MSDHYFTSHPASEQQPRTVEFGMDGRRWRFGTAAGVFSADRLDPGTAVLLRRGAGHVRESGNLLDLGCGWGVIACVLATRAPAATVWAVDVNERALELAAGNAVDLGVAARIRFSLPQDVPADVRFGQIWSNPPIRIGKPALHALLMEWLPRLADDGEAWLVVARNLGADSLAHWLSAGGWICRREASSAGYRVLRVTRPESHDEVRPAEAQPGEA